MFVMITFLLTSKRADKWQHSMDQDTLPEPATFIQATERRAELQDKQVKTLQKQLKAAEKRMEAISSSKAYAPISLSSILSHRPNWRTDYELEDWLPRWLPRQAVEKWQRARTNKTHLHALYEVPNNDDYFWETVVDPLDGWKSESSTFAYAVANNGFGHRLGTLALSFMCNIVPNKKQQVIFWQVPGYGTNEIWHELFEDSPVLTGAPKHWEHAKHFDRVNNHRKSKGQAGDIRVNGEGISKDQDCTHGDYWMYYSPECAGGMCRDVKFHRETWLLRLAREPSAQEFFMLLRAQLRQNIKEKIATFIEENFPKDKIVVGVHIRSGNGKDDGEKDFERKKRGDWLHDLPAAVTMVRKHARMVAASLIDRYNQGDFDANKTDIDDRLRIFVATDSNAVLDEFLKQDPNVLFVPQERMAVGEGVPIVSALQCANKTKIECAIHAEEAMFMDAMIMSSCDAAIAESFSNWMYTLPASLRLAEGRVFCETGRASLGLQTKTEGESIYGPASWHVKPPSSVMPIRCYQGAWAARDRLNLHAVEDVG